MSEHITHVAIFEDGCRLLRLNRPLFPEAFTHSLDKHYDAGVVCSGSRGNHVHAIPIVEKNRGKAAADFSDESLQHLAGALGWISHRAADNTLNPLADEVDALENPMFNGQDLKLYYEIVVMKEVYDGGRKTTGSPYELLSPATLATNMHANPAARHVNIRQFETLVTHYYLRKFLSLMGFTAAEPANDNSDVYLDSLAAHAQYFQENLSLYTTAYGHPHPLKMQEFVYRLNFYNLEDPLIRLVRRLQNGEQATEDDFKNAMRNIGSQCKYAQAIKLNFDFWLALAAYYDGEIERNLLEGKLLM